MRQVTKFPKEDLQDLLDTKKFDGYERISDEIVDTSRWSIHHYMIFKYEGNFYGVGYTRGATESQDEYPFEYEPSMVECDDLIAQTVTKIEYIPKETNENYQRLRG